MASAGRFSFDLETGTISGPEHYMRSNRYAATKAKIEDGSHVLITRSPPGIPVADLVCVILQTDYAAWVGEQRTFENLLDSSPEPTRTF